MKRYLLTDEQIKSLAINENLIEGCLVFADTEFTKGQMEAALGGPISLEKWNHMQEVYLSVCEGKGLKNSDFTSICDFVKKETQVV